MTHLLHSDAAMAELTDMFPQQHITALVIRKGPEEKEIIEIEDFVKVAQILKQLDREDHERQLEEIAKTQQDKVEKLSAELENIFREVKDNGKRLIEQKIKEKHKLLERLKAAEHLIEQNKEQKAKVDELTRKQGEARNTRQRVLRELTQKTHELEKLERKLIFVQREILYKSESALKDVPQGHKHLNTRVHQELTEFMNRYNQSIVCRSEAMEQGSKLEEALETKGEEITPLYQRFHAQKKMMEIDLAALEEKLLHQLKEHEENHQKKYLEKEELFCKSVYESEECFRKELYQTEEHFRKELVEKQNNFRIELTKRHKRFRKELLEKEENMEKKVLKATMKMISERDKKFERDRFKKEFLQNEKGRMKNEVFETLKKELSEREDNFRKELSERAIRLMLELSRTDKDFRGELSRHYETFKKEFSEKFNTICQLISELEDILHREEHSHYSLDAATQTKVNRSFYFSQLC